MPEELLESPAVPEQTPAPQLTPIQQQFLQSLRGAPANVEPFSTGYNQTQGFATPRVDFDTPGFHPVPGFAAVYQPAQSYDDPAYQKSLYEWEQEVRRKAEASRAEQAIQAGMRYIYQQRYDADIKRGVPEQQAFSKMMLGLAMHTPKSDPVKMLKAFQTPPPPSVTNLPGLGPVVTGGKVQFPPSHMLPATPLPATGEVLKHPTTGAEMGVRFPTGRQSGQILGQPPKGTSQFDVIDYRTLGKRREIVEGELDILKKSKDLTPEEQATKAAYEAEIERIKGEEALLNPRKNQATSSGGKSITREQVSAFLRQANGDREKARKLAKDAGYEW